MSLIDCITCLLTTTTTYSEEKTKLHPMFAACYHQEIVDTSIMTGYTSHFPGHRDKGFVYQAIFVPLTERVFYTFIATPHDWKVQQDAESHRQYLRWKDSLSGSEMTKITNFETSFQRKPSCIWWLMWKLGYSWTNSDQFLHFPPILATMQLLCLALLQWMV